MSPWISTTVLIGLCGASLALVAAGCGGAGNDAAGTTTAAATPSEQWAHGTCDALAAWRTEVTDAASTLKTTPTRANAKQAVDDATSATHTLASAMAGLGRPPATTSGNQAREAVQTLQQQLRAGGTKVNEALEGMSGAAGSVEAISTISGTLVTMRDQLAAAGKTLRELPTGELKQAFTSSPACQTLQGSSS